MFICYSTRLTEEEERKKDERNAWAVVVSRTNMILVKLKAKVNAYAPVQLASYPGPSPLLRAGEGLVTFVIKTVAGSYMMLHNHNCGVLPLSHDCGDER